MTPAAGNGFDIQRRLRGLRQLTRKATLDGIYEAQLASIVMDDDSIEAALREIVGVHSNIINTPVVYRNIAQRTEVPAAAARDIVGGMLGMAVSPFEVRNRIGDSVSFSFRDPNFKRYIRIRLASPAHSV